MNKMKNEEAYLITVEDVIKNEDGTTLIFDLSDEFIEWFKKKQGLKRWRNKRFQKVMIEALQRAAQDELKETVIQHLW